MQTFIGEYSNGNYVYSDDAIALKSQLVSILNTPVGERYYWPGYGSHLNEYRFSVLNYFTINMIGQEIKNAITLLDGISLKSISYTIVNNTINFTIELQRLSETINISVAVNDGIAA